jgi:hypothetical protein
MNNLLLTKDKILALPAGKELDALIAIHIYGYEYLEIGYYQHKGPPEDTSTPERQIELEAWLDKPSVVEQYDNSVGEYWIMEASDLILATNALTPSQNISDAWQVVVAMQSKGFYSQHTDLTPDSGQGWWVWHFIKTGLEQVFNGYGSTAPVAICQAALLAILEQAPATITPAATGQFGGLCNRTACRRPGASWYSHAINAYYCGECAVLINHSGGRAVAIELYGHDICTQGLHIPTT